MAVEQIAKLLTQCGPDPHGCVPDLGYFPGRTHWSLGSDSDSIVAIYKMKGLGGWGGVRGSGHWTGDTGGWR